MSVLELSDVHKRFARETGIAAMLKRNQSYVHAVNGVDLSVEPGEICGVVGESGCGKTTLAKLIMRIHELSSGELRLAGRPIDEYDRKSFYREIQMIFQDPFKSLNPRMTIREQLLEPLRVHGFNDKTHRIHESLEFAQLTPPEQYLDKFPHELSGGEKQRVSIASSLLLEPSVIVADEPVSMLDVSVRAGVLELLRTLAEERDVAIVYISHDIATVRYLCDSMAVMYLGKVMEKGTTDRVIGTPAHPYTERLVSATPEADPTRDRTRVVNNEHLPDAVKLPTGCFFKDRCAFAVDACEDESMSLRPPAAAEGDDCTVACHRAVDGTLEWDKLESSVPNRTPPTDTQ